MESIHVDIRAHSAFDLFTPNRKLQHDFAFAARAFVLKGLRAIEIITEVTLLTAVHLPHLTCWAPLT